MLNSIKKVAGVGLAASAILAATASNARAFDFQFSNFNPGGSFSAEGTIRVPDASLSSGTVRQDELDWEINLYDSGVLQHTMIGPGGAFGTPNSEGRYSTAGTCCTVNSEELSVLSNGTLYLHDSVARGLNAFYNSPGNNWDFITINQVTQQQKTSGVTPLVATPVPFGVSTDLSLLILGGLYGASRLRKKLVK